MHHDRYRRVVTSVLSVTAALLISVGSVQAQTPPDNSKVNKRDRAAGATTAGQQKENATDRELTSKIRQALMDDKTLSTYAHNVKIVSQDGKVTLKGPVRSEEEKKIVVAKATEVAGTGKVVNEISIAPAKGAKK